MLLSWNQIKKNAIAFSKKWENEERERAEKDSFWNDFFGVFGMDRKRVASFEEPVKKLSGSQGFIDLFWKGNLLVEHKSKGKDLDKAYQQAVDYFPGIKDHDLPKYILVSDFDRFKLFDLEDKTEVEFSLLDFHKYIRSFGFIAGYQTRKIVEQDPVNIQAAGLIGKLHDKLEDYGFEGHQLEVYLVRLVFCLFADNAGIFDRDILLQYVEDRTNPDGSDLAMHFNKIFQVLNKPIEKRSPNLDEDLQRFPYVNGGVFSETVEIPDFDAEMRKIFLDCCYLDWSKISPAIFGSMFQAVMNPKERRDLGAHYTSEQNILKLIKPLFLDELYEEFNKVKSNTKQLQHFHKKLSTLKFLDPACGCGNFLVITYRELRLLELEVLRVLNKSGQGWLDVSEIIWLDVDQFYGIEYDEWPARIAEVAMWLMDHQMNMAISQEFGEYFVRLPLKKSAKIVHGNALRTDWEEVVPKSELSYIVGNPPFYGKQLQSKVQKEDMSLVFKGVKGAGVLDYVAAWYLLAAKYVHRTQIKVAFVSTNSITQGEQTGILWNEMFNKFETKIHFAHRTFNWKNEARGNAAVHVIIVGFASFDIKSKLLWSYTDLNSDTTPVKVSNINPYLVASSDVVILKRRKALCHVSPISFGSMPNDGGNFLLTEAERSDLLEIEPAAVKVIKPLLSAHEFLNGKKRYCIWLKDVDPTIIRGLKEIQKRVEAVKELRSISSRDATRKLADFPMLFGEIRHSDDNYILVPLHSSERRKYIPLGFFSPDNIANNSTSIIANASLFEFGVLHSIMHMQWVKYTCGRIKSDYRYSNESVYNNYPWPKEPSDKNVKKVEDKAQVVLDARAQFPDSSLADLYDPLLMPPVLVKAHQDLDKAVDLCYRPQAFASETGRIEFLFDLYNEYTDPLLGGKKSKKK